MLPGVHAAHLHMHEDINRVQFFGVPFGCVSVCPLMTSGSSSTTVAAQGWPGREQAGVYPALQSPRHPSMTHAQAAAYRNLHT